MVGGIDGTGRRDVGAQFRPGCGTGEELTARFYRRLFEVAPATRALFPGTDLRRQEHALLSALVALRGALREPAALVPPLEQLGARHVRYGVRPEHYPVVGAVLLEVMAEVGGARWRSEYSAEWARALQFVADAMLAGARRVEQVA
jgi:methyl-accepting chemotaxis protein